MDSQAPQTKQGHDPEQLRLVINKLSNELGNVKADFFYMQVQLDKAVNEKNAMLDAFQKSEEGYKETIATKDKEIQTLLTRIGNMAANKKPEGR